MSKEVNGVMVPDDENYAFPLHARIENGTGGVVFVTSPGMTLRDWFAGQALDATLNASTPPTGTAADMVAKVAYAVADAMMRARGGT